MSLSFTLYRFFDAEDSLLYIGQTINPARRWREHEKSKDWFGEVATVKRETFDSAADLTSAEVAAIKAEKPRYNIAHNDQFSTPRTRRRTPPKDAPNPALREAIASFERRTEASGRSSACADYPANIESDCPCVAHQELRLAELDRIREDFGFENLAAQQILDDLERQADDPKGGYASWVEDLLDVPLILPLQMRIISAEDPCPTFATVEGPLLAVGCPFCFDVHDHFVPAGQPVGSALKAACGGPASESAYAPLLELDYAMDEMAKWCRRNFVLRSEYAEDVA